ncbi:MATE family efflux transporter [Ureaplasma diversum]|nr:MATE family efflux transporter [Ureaplasma diversum]
MATVFKKRFSLKNIFGDKAFIKKMILLFFPAIIQNIIISCISYVDNFFLATHTPDNFGIYTKTAAVLANQILYLPIIFTVAVCFAIGIMTSQYKGSKQYTLFKESVHWMIILSFLVNIPFFIAFMGFGSWSIQTYAGAANQLTNQSKQIDPSNVALFQSINDWSVQYLNLIMIAQIFYTISFPLAVAHRYDGAPFIPLLGSLSALCVNSILDPVLLIKFAKTPTDAIRFVGIATIVARLVDISIVLICVFIRKNRATFIFNHWKLQKSTIKDLFKYGWHIVINESLFSIATILLSLFLYNYHPYAREGISTATLVSQFTKLIWPGLSTIVGNLVLSYLGKHDIKTAKLHSRYIIAWSLVFSIFLAIVLFIASFFINSVLNKPSDQTSAAIAKAKEAVDLAKYLEWVLAFQILCIGPYAAMNNCIRGSGRKYGSISDTIIMVIWVLMIGLITNFVSDPKVSVIGLFTLISANMAIKLVSTSIMYTKCKWANPLTNKINNKVNENKLNYRFSVQK